MLIRKGQTIKPSINHIKDAANIKDKEHILFIGKQMIMTPGELIFDKSLSDGDKIFWCSLREMSSNATISELPSQGEIAIMLGKSRPSIISYMKMLRATRWLVILNTKYQNNLPTKFDYAISDVQLGISDVVDIDKGYIDFLLDEIAVDKTSRIKSICLHTLSQINDNQLNLLSEQQANRFAKLCEQQLLIDKKALNVNNFDNGENPDVKNFDSGENLDVKNFDSGENLDVKNFDSGKNPDVKNFDSGYIYIIPCAHAPPRT